MELHMYMKCMYMKKMYVYEKLRNISTTEILYYCLVLS